MVSKRPSGSILEGFGEGSGRIWEGLGRILGGSWEDFGQFWGWRYLDLLLSFPWRFPQDILFSRDPRDASPTRLASQCAGVPYRV